jgi:hypothetical protein
MFQKSLGLNDLPNPRPRVGFHPSPPAAGEQVEAGLVPRPGLLDEDEGFRLILLAGVEVCRMIIPPNSGGSPQDPGCRSHRFSGSSGTTPIS